MSTEIELVRASQVEAKPLRWLWPEYIPLGGLTLFVGATDTGKTLAALDIAARITDGALFPDAAKRLPPSEVLLIGDEADDGDVTVPRLMAMRADLSKIRFAELDGDFDLARDVPALTARLTAHPAIRMIIVDPFVVYIGDGANGESQLRATLAPLRELASRFTVAIVMTITTQYKKIYTGNIVSDFRLNGMSVLTGVARAVWYFQKINDVEGTTHNQCCTMSRVKNNLGKNAPGLNFHIAERPVPIPNDPDLLVPHIVWGGRIEPSSSRHENPKLQQAVAWLQIALQDGAVMTKKLFDDAREGAGIRQETLRRACQALGIKPQKMAHRWVWALPSLAGASVEAAAPEDRVSCATSGERLGPKPTLLQSGSLHLC
jgi:putative DNA primase/helicase